MLPKTISIGMAVWMFVVNPTVADEWPQWRGPNRDGVWHEDGIIDKFEAARLEPEWRQPIGSGYCGPTVAEGSVFVMDREVTPEQVERVHCFDWKLGSKLWTFSYPCEYTISYEAGPRASVTIDDGRAFALGAMGHLHCLDVTTGQVLWKHDLNAEFKIAATNRMPIWGIACSPLIVDDLVIVPVGAERASIVAFEKRSGDLVWQSLNDRAQYSAPILIEQAGRPVVVCWTGDSVAGLDPSNGEVLWRHGFAPAKMPIGIATPLIQGDRLFVTSFYDGSLMLRLNSDRLAVEPIWRRSGRDERNTDALHSIMSTPLFDAEHIYGVDSYGELRCLSAATGDRLWEDRTATPTARWSNIHFVRNGENIWMFNERGELVIGRLSPSGFRETSRAQLIEPTMRQLPQRGGVCWAHPAFAHRHVFIRNDDSILCVDLERD